jgi:hypothetical protein
MMHDVWETSSVTSMRAELLRRAVEELHTLESQLVEAELELATFEQRITDFEREYQHLSDDLRKELDRLDRLFVQQLAADQRGERVDPEEPQAQRRKTKTHPEERDSVPRFTPSPSLQKLYREAAKQFHPDLAENDEDSEWRTGVMRQVNAAFAAGDAEALERIMKRERTGTREGDQVDPENAQIQHKIGRVRARLAEVARRKQELASSEVGRLFLEAERLGRDAGTYLRDFVEALSAEIDIRRQQLRDIARRNRRE